mgnify:CR=1 FL=1
MSVGRNVQFNVLPMVATLGWMGFLIFLSSQTLTTDLTAHLEIRMDIVAHIVLYSVLGFLISTSLLLNTKLLISTNRIAFIAPLFCLFWGIIDESYQKIVPGRDSSWTDVGFDLIGGIIGTALLAGFATMWVHLKSHD